MIEYSAPHLQQLELDPRSRLAVVVVPERNENKLNVNPPMKHHQHRALHASNHAQTTSAGNAIAKHTNEIELDQQGTNKYLSELTSYVLARQLVVGDLLQDADEARHQILVRARLLLCESRAEWMTVRAM
jgi:hypothetical protein